MPMMTAEPLQFLLMVMAGWVNLENQLLTPAAPPANDNAPIARRERLGGLLNFYFRCAA